MAKSPEDDSQLLAGFFFCASLASHITGTSLRFQGMQYCIESEYSYLKRRGTSMKKLINKPENGKETMEGIILCLWG